MIGAIGRLWCRLFHRRHHWHDPLPELKGTVICRKCDRLVVRMRTGAD